ncbi:MAG TPA: hypothetical protein VME41_18305 [Stellaceae bacterium]|nr:hypothetical protein [Stellaceae bacterium]
MNESRGPHQPSHQEHASAEAVREAALDAARQEAAEVAREIAADLVAAESALAAREDLPDPVTQAINAEIAAFSPPLSPQAQDVLADLLRLHYSLNGPQRALETSGNFNRPVFPAPPRYIGS